MVREVCSLSWPGLAGGLEMAFFLPAKMEVYLVGDFLRVSVAACRL